MNAALVIMAAGMGSRYGGERRQSGHSFRQGVAMRFCMAAFGE